eukprot:CAMPEP_0118952804 /NCGR_PEP_ID=MMETSP1169-20130426/55496_1 /TAXON_ID=36882 /ORGANISM="Pyramimonas obovata, Strain CCMP722" /LENGTH=120 /DNA_ID=CAMNT_0006900135 /DNA_START=324 /DNA_END=683 /DNA_ORIENTATION=-
MSSPEEIDLFLDAEEDLPQDRDNFDAPSSPPEEEGFEDAQELSAEDLQEALQISRAVISFATGYQRASLRTDQANFEGCQRASMVPPAPFTAPSRPEAAGAGGTRSGPKPPLCGPSGPAT